MSKVGPDASPDAAGANDAWDVGRLDVDAYLARVDHDGDLSPTVGTLRSLHRAHTAVIPFENLDVVLGRGVSLEMDDIQRKLVRHRRGGYCYEHNLLFAALLERLGYRVKRLAARVRADDSGLRTHMLLVVEVEGGAFLADVGFGATLLEPIPLEEGAVSRQGGWTYGLARDGDGSWWLRSRDAEGWTDLYSFTEEPQLPADYAVYNHYTATHPDSPFVGQPRVVRVEPEVRYTLGGRTLIAKQPDGLSRKRDLSGEEAAGALQDTFGIVLEPEEVASIFGAGGVPRAGLLPRDERTPRDQDQIG